MKNFEEEPSNFVFNMIFVVILLVLGGVFAGTTGHNNEFSTLTESFSFSLL